ncbi:hypothetical protein [Streptomyces varsoviensis]|uniref:Uncharacterized protein n=1 Tax=Streptomyces varsoviensis TaxID=67373 RepID=A0ABR5IXX7_9ACTN|nr:hypothetical protein [Streptomyces varsoviensis]KOG86007.1 hypothetical protein ADK38_33480 [Streptomyces varsoviensis]
MVTIICASCAESPFGIQADGMFKCIGCGELLAVSDIDLDGTDVWAVGADGTLGYVSDPAAALTDLMEAVEDFLSSDQCPNAEYARIVSQISATEALGRYIDARRAGIAAPRLGYTEDQIHTAVNEGADMVIEALNLGGGETDAINLAANGALFCLANPGSSFAEMVEENYGETVEEIRSWWGWN